MAIKTDDYDYYHLISGSDLPIKSQDYIHSFFDIHKGKEFVGFDHVDINQFKDRWSFFHVLQDEIGQGNIVTRRVERLILDFQKVIKVDRTRSDRSMVFLKGVNWFSITNDLAKYVINKKDWIEDTFKETRCCDEVFLQTIIANSEFKDRVFSFDSEDDNAAAMREIDWKRGLPYTWRAEDYLYLLNSSMLFARKFSSDVDSEIITKIVRHLKPELEVKMSQ